MTGAYLESLLVRAGVELAIAILVKASIVIVVAGIVTILLKHKSAASRNAIWSSALAVLIMLPAMSLLLPSWELGKYSQSTESDLMSGNPAAVAQMKPISSLLSEPIHEPAGADPASQGQTAILGRNTILSMLIGLWLCGTVFLLSHLAIHLIRVRRITHKAVLAKDEELSAIAARIVNMLGIHRPVRVLSSRDTTIPFSWGVFRPVVVLPVSSIEWSYTQKSCIMMHELAHIARWDYPIHLLVEIVRVLYWPNPLVWYAARRNAMERERACDDFAVRRGTPSRIYASHLIQIASCQMEHAPIGATTMASEPGLFERILCVMNNRLDRSPIHIKSLLAILSVSLALAMPLATLKIASARGAWEIPPVKRLIDCLKKDDDPLARRRAAWWLGEHESRKAVGPLIDALEDRSSDVRLVAGWALGEIKDTKAIYPLIDVLKRDGDPLVREMAALALGEIEDPDALPPLFRAFDQEEDLRGAIIWALGEIRGEKARLVRQAAFSKWNRTPKKNEEVWTGNLESGETFSDDMPALLRRLESKDAEERRRAAWNLGFLGILDGLDSIEPVVDGLMDALRDPVPEVRAMAIWSLDEVNPSRSLRTRPGRLDESELHERRLNQLGYYLLSFRKYDKAVEVFKTNAKLHPDSWNCYDSLAEAYMMKGEIELAILNYNKSLELNPLNRNAEKMLEALREFE